MLYPQSNSYRQIQDLSGFWNFRIDPDASGAWSAGFEGGQPIAVPASWNDQLNDLRDYLGVGWYQTTFSVPAGWLGQPIFIRFGSVNYLAEVWLNGTQIGQHEGGHLPFAFEISSHVQAEANVLVVRVDGELAPDRVPPGNIPPDPKSPFGGFLRNFPANAFDFFPYCGIQRPVQVYTVPQKAIQDVTVTTDIEGTTGVVQVAVEHSADAGQVRATLKGFGTELVQDLDDSSTLRVENAALWSPDQPNLYDLTLELLVGDTIIDRYTLPVGIRTIQVAGDQLLLNGEPVQLTGFGRHEDFPVMGRGYVPAVMIKDFELMRWVGANSFRTTHYPYAEEMMALADRLGFLVIDETQAVGLYFAEHGLERRRELCHQFTRELIARDKNHPSVIMWSLANEPFNNDEKAGPFFRELYDLAKALDPTRPVTVVNVGMINGPDEPTFEFVDVLCMNRYYGWYSQGGNIDDGIEVLEAELDATHAKFGKPIILSEFGADTLPGWHAEPSEMFSEEYQTEFLTKTINLLNQKSYVVGQHVWNLCDFKTSQAVFRTAAMNFKGVFTRDRRPKMAAHRLRELWRKEE
ncbi:MAG: beta-glucuronidase [Anaerolineaceae bacterium]|nr:beta-glucuronidase [Anaerolineaceae bacterium]